MGFDGPVDLEFGNDRYFSVQAKNIAKWYMHNESKIRKVLIAFTVLTLAMVFKSGRYNMDRAIASATAISLDEVTYVPFQMAPSVELGVVQTDSRVFQVHTSNVNRRMQHANLIEASHVAQTFLNKTGNVCIHLKYFKVPYDIIVFTNLTMVNPETISESSVRKNIKQASISGEISWVKRSTSVTVKFTREDLDQTQTTLWHDQAFCYSFYI